MKNSLVIIALFWASLPLNAQSLPTTPIKEVTTNKTLPFPQTIQKGKINLVCFWGTWCAHGKHQVQAIAPNLRAWQKQYNLNFIPIATDEQTTEHLLLPYIHKQKWTFPIYLDPNSELKNALHVTSALPYTMIFDKNRKLIYTHTGYIDAPGLLKKITQIH